jgi:thioredoxin reductase (NADPH)
VNKITIIGSGPAGLTCSVYAARSGLEPVVIAGNLPGGQLINTDLVENFPGFDSIIGVDLMTKMIAQAEKNGVNIVYEEVQKVHSKTEGGFEIVLRSGEKVFSQTIVVATGAKHKHLNVPGEKELTNRGVSWCATCDGPMFKGMDVAVVGGGNTALMEALFLSNIANTVYVIHRRDSFRADRTMQDRVFANPKIKILWDSSITKIEKDNVIINGNSTLAVKGVFIAIGTSPLSEIVRDLVDCDPEGYIIADETETSCKGIFAAGDVVSGALKQAVFATGQGALAATRVEKYLGIR